MQPVALLTASALGLYLRGTRGHAYEVGPQLRNRVGNASSEWRDDSKYKRHGSAETVHDRIFTPRRLSPHIYIIELAGAVLERAGFSCVMRNLG